MYEEAKRHRDHMKAKARSLAEGHKGKVDASTYDAPRTFDAEEQTGPKPVGRRAFRSGGKVCGEGSMHHAGKKPRIGNKAPDLPAAGVSSKHPGMNLPHPRARGGRAKRESGGEVSSPATNVSKSQPVAGESRSPVGYHIIDRHTGARVGRAKTLSAASRSVDRRDNAHGGYRYSHKAIYEPHEFQKGGAVHPDEKQDRALVNRMVKKDALTGKASGGEANGHWIAGATKNKGALHRELHVPAGKKIPEKKLEKAEHSKNPTERKRANLAETLKHMDRPARASGGRAKGKTNVNVIIATHPNQPQAMAQPAPQPGPQIPPPMPPRPAPQAQPMPAPPMGAGQPPQPPQLPRKRGGRIHERYGAGSGPGRIEKAERQARAD
jgi:hypothetical protein